MAQRSQMFVGAIFDWLLEFLDLTEALEVVFNVVKDVADGFESMIYLALVVGVGLPGLAAFMWIFDINPTYVSMQSLREYITTEASNFAFLAPFLTWLIFSVVMLPVAIQIYGAPVARRNQKLFVVAVAVLLIMDFATDAPVIHEFLLSIKDGFYADGRPWLANLLGFFFYWGFYAFLLLMGTAGFEALFLATLYMAFLLGLKAFGAAPKSRSGVSGGSRAGGRSTNRQDFTSGHSERGDEARAGARGQRHPRSDRERERGPVREGEVF